MAELCVIAGLIGSRSKAAKSMFVRNNEKIDTKILRDRVLLAIGDLKRHTTDRAAAPPGEIVLDLQKTSPQGDAEVKLAPPHARFTDRFAAWIWCFVHLPRIYTIAESTRSRLASCEQKLEVVARRVDNLEQRLTGLEEQVVTDLEKTTPS